MNKTELINTIAKKTDLSKNDTAKVLDAFIETIKETLATSEKVTLMGFGTFEVHERAEREGRNPRTGEKVIIAASKVPAFKAGKAFKEEMN